MNFNDQKCKNWKKLTIWYYLLYVLEDRVVVQGNWRVWFHFLQINSEWYKIVYLHIKLCKNIKTKYTLINCLFFSPLTISSFHQTPFLSKVNFLCLRAFISCSTVVPMSAWMATADVTELCNSSAQMSTWMTLTLLWKRGGLPKCNIQLSLAPSSKTTSHCCRAVVLALATQRSSVSGTTPLPIGVGKNGRPVEKISRCTGFSALP